ncbi:hypothetical protein BGY98DRAFT_296721 [Russula aff. rugulosa BPL654]|nr:hypothetical protein BGY98DRAFT_296721 [Russula aff. rugulosa BPL654]
MSSGKQQPSLCIDGLGGGGNSASGVHSSSSSAIGANFSMCGPKTCSDYRGRLCVSVQCKGHLLGLLHCFLAVEISIKETVGPELAFFLPIQPTVTTGMLWEKQGSGLEKPSRSMATVANEVQRTWDRATTMISVHMLSLMGQNCFIASLQIFEGSLIRRKFTRSIVVVW